MMSCRTKIILAVVACAMAGPAAAGTSFLVFWRGFQAAVARNNMTAVAKLTRLPFYLDRTITDASALPPALAGLFDASTRACLAAGKPIQDGAYWSVTCGSTQFGFDANEGRWQFTGIAKR